MSIVGNRRPRIPSAFMSPEWPSHSTTGDEVASVTPTPTRTTFTSYPSESEPDTPKPNDSFSKPRKHIPKINRIRRETLDALKQELTAQIKCAEATRHQDTRKPGSNHADDASSPTLYSSSDVTSTHNSTPSSPHTSDSEWLAYSLTESLYEHYRCNAVEPSTSISKASVSSLDPNASYLQTAASLRLIRSSLRQNKNRQVSGSQLHNRSNNVLLEAFNKEVALHHAEQHKISMLKICAAEERAYEGRWAKIQNLDPNSLNGDFGSERGLRFFQVPWPVQNPVMFSPEGITKENVEAFVLSPFRKASLTDKEKIVEEAKRWDDETLEMTVLEKVKEGEKEYVREGMKRVRDILKSANGRLR